MNGSIGKLSVGSRKDSMDSLEQLDSKKSSLRSRESNRGRPSPPQHYTNGSIVFSELRKQAEDDELVGSNNAHLFAKPEESERQVQELGQPNLSSKNPAPVAGMPLKNLNVVRETTETGQGDSTAALPASVAKDANVPLAGSVTNLGSDIIAPPVEFRGSERSLAQHSTPNSTSERKRAEDPPTAVVHPSVKDLRHKPAPVLGQDTPKSVLTGSTVARENGPSPNGSASSGQGGPVTNGNVGGSFLWSSPAVEKPSARVQPTRIKDQEVLTAL